ncbi:MAG: alpha/beta fold hydrolase [Phycisphaerae bacterium]|jgi:haloalkane dehalogenase
MPVTPSTSVNRSSTHEGETAGSAAQPGTGERTGERDPRLARLGELYPFDSHRLDVVGARMHYLDEGEPRPESERRPPPILMLHGNPTWSFYFRDLVKGLRDRNRIVVPDHVGCGLSDKPQNYPYTLSTHIDNVERLVEHLDLRDVTLAVHDWGGPIGFGWAVRHPERVARFIVFNTSAFLGGRLPFRIRMCRWPVVGDLAVRRMNAFARAAIRMACSNRSRMTPSVAAGYLLPYGSAADRVGIQCFVRDIPLSPRAASYRVIQGIEAGLAEVSDRPMTILWGMQDFCFTETFLHQWTRRFPHAAVHRLADAGHYVVEDAHERILPVVRSFLDERAFTDGAGS